MNDEAAKLYFGLTELQRKRLEYDAENRRLDAEITKVEFKFNRMAQKISTVKQTFIDTKDECKQIEEKLRDIECQLEVQETATSKMCSTLSSYEGLLNTLKEEVHEKSTDYKNRLQIYKEKVKSTEESTG
jgi:chromosome segregation ATPase